jgi:tetratricopeptide (TPR) repeat protein
MPKLRPTLLATLLTIAIASAPAFAIDSIQPSGPPNLVAVRAKIKAKDWTAAIAELNGMIDKGVQHADVYNLLGFSLRNQGDTRTAQTYYQKALEFDPDHKGALEYQGELYVKLGDLARAEANLAKLVRLCPQGCEERADLEEAIKSRTVKAR